MRNDIATREDIDQLMISFYGRAMADPVIGYLFTEVAKLDLDHHLPMIGDFWESVLFGGGVYSRHGRNPLQVHEQLDRKSPLEPQHFERWLVLFSESVDESFSGMRAAFVKQRSAMIARRMLEFIGSRKQGA